MTNTFFDRIASWARTMIRSTCFYVVAFIDGSFEAISEPFTTLEEAALYSRGFVSGAGRMSVSSVRAFVLPYEHVDLIEFAETGVDITPALAAMAAAIEGRTASAEAAATP